MTNFIKALTELSRLILESFGAEKTIGIIIGLVLLSIIYRLYSDYRKDKEVNAVIAEKERTIQRLAQDNREWRILFLKEKYNWSVEEIERFIHKNDFKDGPEARKFFEGDP